MTRTRRGITLGGLIMAGAAGTYGGITILGARAILDGDAFTGPIPWPTIVLPTVLLGAILGAAVGLIRRRPVVPGIVVGAVSLPVCLAMPTARDDTGGPVILTAGVVAVAYYVARRIYATRPRSSAQRQPANRVPH